MIRNSIFSTLCVFAILMIADSPHCAEAFDAAGDQQDSYVGA